MNLKTYMPEGRFFEIMEFTEQIRGVGGYSKYIYERLTKYAYRNDHCFVSQATLARISESSIRTVQRCLARLSQRGLVRIVQDGGLKKYYLTIPKDLEALAEKYDLFRAGHGAAKEELEGAVTPLDDEHDNLSPANDALSDRHDNLSPVQEALPAEAVNLPEGHDSLSGTHDNLSPINKSKNNTNSPLPPRKNRSTRDTSSRFGWVGSFSSLEQKQKIQEEFQELEAHYPRNDDLREALEVFVQLRSSLPPIGELVSIIEHEKSNNSKWQRGYAPFLRNWLKFRQFETALQFIKAGSERLAKTAAAVTALARQEECQPVREEPVGEGQPFIESDFEACANLWGLNSTARMVMRAYWSSTLSLGILPSTSAAQAARSKFSSMAAWLKAFKLEEYSKIKNALGSTNSSCVGNQVCCAAA